MTDAKNKDDDALALEWTDELASWELDLDETAQAESSPFPHGQSETKTAQATPLVPAPGNPDNDADFTDTALSIAPLATPSRRGPPPPPAAALQTRPPRLSSPESGGERPRMYRPPSPAELLQLERSMQETLPPPSSALDADGNYASLARPRAPFDTDLAPIPAEVLGALSFTRALDATQPPPSPYYGQGETARPATPDNLTALPTPLVQAPLEGAASETAQHDLGELQARDSAPERSGTEAASGPVLEVMIESAEQAYADENPREDTQERAARRRRITLLEALALKAEGSADELLISAAELAEELGDVGRAESLYERALADAPKRPAALKALIRLAFRAGDTVRYALLLERLAELPLPRGERARVLTTLALARWLLEHDAPAALTAVRQAQRLAPEQVAPNLLLARIEAASQPDKIDATLVPLSLRTQDLSLASLWLVTAARALEARGDLEAARTLYARAAADDPFAFDAQFSLSRMNHALGAHAEAARALLRTLESFDIGPVAEAVRRRAAHMLGVQGVYAEAVELLEHASDDVSLRTAAQIALASEDLLLKQQAAEAWTLGTDGSERALALLTQAELFAESGDSERADSTLQLAALADPSLSLVRVQREALARKSGNTTRLAEIAASEAAGRGALAAAAQLALSLSAAQDELRWLSEAAAQESGVAAHLLAIDASAELGRDDDLRRLLRAESERGAAPAQVLALLALAAFEHKRGDQAQQRDILWQAAELAPRDVGVLRAYTRASPSPEEAAQVYRSEGENSTGMQAAFAHLCEGFVLPAGSTARLDAFSTAHTAAPDYPPASWALHREARRQGDLGRLGELHASAAEQASGPHVRASHLVRAALIRASEDTAAAAEQLTQALLLMPDDPVLIELVLRLGDAADASVRAAALDRMAARAEAPYRRQLVIGAAGTLEDAGQLAEAAERYRVVLSETPNDPVADAGLERVTVEAEHGLALLELKRRAVLDASTERARARALEELLLLETDLPRGLELAHELFALSPSHPLALRALERDAMERDDRALLLTLQQRMIESGRGPRDKAARMRFVHLLRALEPEDESALQEFDRSVLASEKGAPHSLWLSRQLLSSAIALGQHQAVLRALELAIEQASDPVERASLVIQRGWLTIELKHGTLADTKPSGERDSEPGSAPNEASPGRLLDVVREALVGYPEHPTGLELIAESRAATGDFAAAAEQFEQAATRAISKERSAYLWARAAELWDKLKQPERARDALQRAAARDLDQPGVRERLAELLTAQGDLDGLVALTTARIAQGGAKEQQVDLLRTLSALEEQRGDRGAARAALRAALAEDPESLPAWRDLARLGERAENHPERVEGLSAVVRLSRDPLELRDALLELGEVYEKHIGDPTRAEAAYQRVLKLGPRNTTALERLARLYRAGGSHDLAAETLLVLSRSASDPRQKRDVTLQLASWKEEQGDVRAAEELLEALRRAQPTDQHVLRNLTGLLRRSNAHVALAMHLNRAVNDLRQALITRFDDPELWLSIVEMLVERGRLDVASQCASTASALGVHAPQLKKAEHGEASHEGIGAPAMSELLDDLVFPEDAPPSLRIVFRHAADALNRTSPLDLPSLGAEKLDKRHPLRTVVTELARWVAHREIEVFVSSELPYAFVPIQDAPVQLLVGRALVDSLSEDEQRFLVARALKIARAQMSICCRIGPQQMELLLHGLVRSQVASHAPSFLELSALEDAAKRVTKQLSRRAQTDLIPSLLELTYAGVPRFDAANVYGVASAAGSRAGLLATGNVGAALSALIKLSGMSLENAGPAAAVAQVEEARELVAFAISDAYFEARTRAGKEAR